MARPNLRPAPRPRPGRQSLSLREQPHPPRIQTLVTFVASSRLVFPRSARSKPRHPRNSESAIPGRPGAAGRGRRCGRTGSVSRLVITERSGNAGAKAATRRVAALPSANGAQSSNRAGAVRERGAGPPQPWLGNRTGPSTERWKGRNLRGIPRRFGLKSRGRVLQQSGTLSVEVRDVHGT